MTRGPEGLDDSEEAGRRRARRRQRQFGYHLVAYFVVMIVLVPLNFLVDRGNPWFVFPLVAWGAPLAVHAAYAMGLLDPLFRRKQDR